MRSSRYGRAGTWRGLRGARVIHDYNSSFSEEESLTQKGIESFNV